ncbi:signal recognition particle-docking protein FtsY [Candidatus Micrarchaeota archaeon]|nr:signal recognition particle-docking protein FtsY [Candidatus Micrarchaeota archaeon]
MFGLLKDKLSGFVNKLTKKEEEKQKEEIKEEIEEINEDSKEEETLDNAPEKQQEPKKQETTKTQEDEKPKEKKEVKKKTEEKEATEEKEKIENKELKDEPKEKEKIEENEEEKPVEIKQVIEKHEEIEIEKPKQEPKIEKPIEEIKPKQDKKIKLSLESRLRGLISRKIKIKEKDINSLLEELELSLLESDVNLDVASALKEEIRTSLVDKELDKSDLEEQIRESIKQALINIMDHEDRFDLVEKVKYGKKPYKILFIGPNGAGKTTTIAKVSKLLENNNLSSVLSASDTFRAAAIEQIGIHGERLNKKVIKGKYGADPTSIAYDAVNHAKSNNLDAVLIDSAGRQETNKNLVDQLRKLGRIIEPDLTIYIGESIAGHSVIDQIKEFNQAVKIQGVILTKLDCDAKGGNAISIPRATNIPVVYVGVGQEYEDLIPFKPDQIADEILG